MRSMFKTCFYVSLILIVCSTFSLLRADINEGTGKLMGAAYSCGDCQDGGDSCVEPVKDTCNDKPDYPPCNGVCVTGCSGTKGKTCVESENGAVMCDDSTGLCADSTQDKCISYVNTQNLTECGCDSDEATDVDCGTAYNKCTSQ